MLKNDIFKNILQCYKNSLRDTINHDGVEHAGYIAFLCMLSIFPIFIFFTATIVTFSNKYLEGVSGESILHIITSILAESDFSNLIIALQPRIVEITSTPPQSFLGLAILSVIWTASSLFEGLRTIMNRAYRVSNPPSYILRRALSIVQFIFFTFIVMMIIFSIKLLPIILGWILVLLEDVKEYSFITSFLTIFLKLTDSFSHFIGFGIYFLLLSYIYYLIPNKTHSLRETFPGTFNTIIFWFLSNKCFQFYLSTFQQINIVYGSVAGIIIALLYFYICSLIFIYGAELNHWISEIFNNKKLKNK